MELSPIQKRADGLCRLEYMLRCKRDILRHEQDEKLANGFGRGAAVLQRAIGELDDAIVRVSGNLAKAIAAGG